MNENPTEAIMAETEKRGSMWRGLLWAMLVVAPAPALVWLGPIRGHEWAGNLLMFWAWLSLVITLTAWVILLSMIAAKQSVPSSEGKRPPALIRWSAFLFTVGVLAASGWFVTAAVWVVRSALAAVLLTAWNDQDERKAAA